MSNLTKTAVDAAAAAYWTEFFSATGYGALWVKDVPKKVKACLALNLKRTAGLDETQISGLSVVPHDLGVTIEGLASFPNQTVKAFVADFTHEGDIVAFDVV